MQEQTTYNYSALFATSYYVVQRASHARLYQGPVHLAQAVRWNVELEDAQRQWRLTGSWHSSDDRFVLEPRG